MNEHVCLSSMPKTTELMILSGTTTLASDLQAKLLEIYQAIEGIFEVKKKP